MTARGALPRTDIVITGLVPVIRGYANDIRQWLDMDGRTKSGHDEKWLGTDVRTGSQKFTR